MVEMNSTQPRVCSFESRRAEEMSHLIERHGGVAVSAPSMRELPIEENPEAIQCLKELIEDRFSMTVLMTGVGTDALFELARTQGVYEQVLDALKRTTLVIRGPKPAVVLSKVGLRYDLKAPEPNTWRELLTALEAAAVDQPDRFGINGRRIAVQEYGLPNLRFYEALRNLGAEVIRIPVYRWALPEDTGPLKAAIHQMCSGQIDIALFTSANQVTNVLQVASELQLEEGLRTAFQKMVLASIGPTCTEALTDQGLRVDFEASPPKMGQLVRGAIEKWTAG
jgi:uroporphyrinogen-III synthase